MEVAVNRNVKVSTAGGSGAPATKKPPTAAQIKKSPNGKPEPAPATSGCNKRLPWQADVLCNEFTPQVYEIKLLENCMRFYEEKRRRTTSASTDETLTSRAFNSIICVRNRESRNYLRIMLIKEYAMRLNVEHASSKGRQRRKLIVVLTNLGSDVSKYIELVSTHTTLKIAGIDTTNFSSLVQGGAGGSSSNGDGAGERSFGSLKNEAQLIIIPVHLFLESLKLGLVSMAEIALLMASYAAPKKGYFGSNDHLYAELFKNHYPSTAPASTWLPIVVCFADLAIANRSSVDELSAQIGALKTLFEADQVETATDLIDTNNMLNYIEPAQNVMICDSGYLISGGVHNGGQEPAPQVDELLSSCENGGRNGPYDQDRFKRLLVGLIRETYVFLESDAAASSRKEKPFIHELLATDDLLDSGAKPEPPAVKDLLVNNLCMRIMNECLYLLNEVGVWCLTKTFLTYILQLDKLAGAANFGSSLPPVPKRPPGCVVDLTSPELEEWRVQTLDPDADVGQFNFKQRIMIQYTSTRLRLLRELCIKHLINSKKERTRQPTPGISLHRTGGHRHHHHYTVAYKSPEALDYFMEHFTTQKVSSLVKLLRERLSPATDGDGHLPHFSCLLFVQNKQVAISMSLLLKKLAKDDRRLGYLKPNYIIESAAGEKASVGQEPKKPAVATGEAGANASCLKQEEIIRKFFAGEINLLICTHEMEKHINSPPSVNLIVRFNCAESFQTSSWLSRPPDELDDEAGGDEAELDAEKSASIAQTAAVFRFKYLNDYKTLMQTNHGTPGPVFTYHRYVETKMRAQNKQAVCYYIIEREQLRGFLSQLLRFKQIETLLKENFSNLMRQFAAEGLAGPARIPAGPKPKHFSLDNAIELLNRYCIRLPSDALTQLTPTYKIEQRRESDGSTRHRCLLHLPINCGLTKDQMPIVSDWTERGVFASKMMAAYKACLLLYLNSELNDAFEPITKEMFYRLNNRFDEDDEREWAQFNRERSRLADPAAASSSARQQQHSYMSHRPGGAKRKQIYNKQTSTYLVKNQLVTTQHPAYLYLIKFELTTGLKGPAPGPATTADESSGAKSFGLLVSRPLLELVDFPIFTQNGEETVSLVRVQENIYFTPNQLRSIKCFHKFIFSNVLKMEGRGAHAAQSLNAAVAGSGAKQADAAGYYVCVLNEAPRGHYALDWELMKLIETCNDEKHFMRLPRHAHVIHVAPAAADDDEAEDEEEEERENGKYVFEYDEALFKDAVVVPFYRNCDSQAQYYCVVEIDHAMSPLSPFPISSANKHHQMSAAEMARRTGQHQAGLYETFLQYFAYKYNVLIRNTNQPLLIVSHPSTRLNLLTPRYMNLKASVLQKSSFAPGKPHQDGKLPSNRIYLVPELVNVHPFKASTWRRCLCLPSVLYRVNSLLLVEELRRGIASSTGVGVPWWTGGGEADVEPERALANGFVRLAFNWDADKELEVSNVPDVEIDPSMSRGKSDPAAALAAAAAAASESSKKLLETPELDPNWNFEISEWDDSCLKELNGKGADGKTPTSMSEANFIQILSTSTNHSAASGWHDDGGLGNGNALFIDPDELLEYDEDYAAEQQQQQQLNGDETSRPLNGKHGEAVKLEEITIHNNQMSLKKEIERLKVERETGISSGEAESNEPAPAAFSVELEHLKQEIKSKAAKRSALPSLSRNETETFIRKYLLEASAGAELLADNVGSIEYLDELVASLKDVRASAAGLLSKFNFIAEFSASANRTDVVRSEQQRKIEELASALRESRARSLIETTPGSDETVEGLKIFPTISLPIKMKKDDLGQILGAQEGSEASEDASGFVENGAVEGEIEPETNGVASLRNTDWSFHFNLDDDEHRSRGEDAIDIGPGPALLLQALTLANAADGFDLERLETVGDSFLKQAITVYLFFKYPNVHEGKLSYMRSKQVSNYNLYKLGKRRGLHELIVSAKFEPLDSWLPAHYESTHTPQSQPPSAAQRLLSSLLSADSGAAAKSTGPEKAEHFDKYNQHFVSDKSVADCVEAMIGAYLIASGPRAALQVMSWFGLNVLPKVKAVEVDASQPNKSAEFLIDSTDQQSLQIAKLSLSGSAALVGRYNGAVKSQLRQQLLDGYSTFEACIGYKFHNPFFLLQAFTHSSYTYNPFTDCYQRLEFLGDAILDYVITRHLYEDKKRHSPGELTDLRSALVNNNIFAYLAVKYDFYKYFKYLSPSMFPIIDNFVKNQKSRNDEFDLEEDFFDYEIDDDELEDDEFLYEQTGSSAGGSSESAPTHEHSDDDFDVPSHKSQDGGKKFAGAAKKDGLGAVDDVSELEEMEVPKCLGDIFESVAGAIYLDSNKSFNTVWRVYYGLMKPYIDKFTTQVPKSPIRELFELEPESAKFEKPERTINGKIRVTVSISGRGKFRGVGRNYRIAKNAAAKLALKYLKNNH